MASHQKHDNEATSEHGDDNVGTSGSASSATTSSGASEGDDEPPPPPPHPTTYTLSLNPRDATHHGTDQLTTTRDDGTETMPALPNVIVAEAGVESHTEIAPIQSRPIAGRSSLPRPPPPISSGTLVSLSKSSKASNSGMAKGSKNKFWASSRGGKKAIPSVAAMNRDERRRKRMELVNFVYRRVSNRGSTRDGGAVNQTVGEEDGEADDVGDGGLVDVAVGQEWEMVRVNPGDTAEEEFWVQCQALRIYHENDGGADSITGSLSPRRPDFVLQLKPTTEGNHGHVVNNTLGKGKLLLDLALSGRKDDGPLAGDRKGSRKVGLENLPDEILLEIFSYMPDAYGFAPTVDPDLTLLSRSTSQTHSTSASSVTWSSPPLHLCLISKRFTGIFRELCYKSIQIRSWERVLALIELFDSDSSSGGRSAGLEGLVRKLDVKFGPGEGKGSRNRFGLRNRTRPGINGGNGSASSLLRHSPPTSYDTPTRQSSDSSFASVSSVSSPVSVSSTPSSNTPPRTTATTTIRSNGFTISMQTPTRPPSVNVSDKEGQELLRRLIGRLSGSGRGGSGLKFLKIDCVSVGIDEILDPTCGDRREGIAFGYGTGTASGPSSRHPSRNGSSSSLVSMGLGITSDQSQSRDDLSVSWEAPKLHKLVLKRDPTINGVSTAMRPYDLACAIKPLLSSPSGLSSSQASIRDYTNENSHGENGWTGLRELEIKGYHSAEDERFGEFLDPAGVDADRLAGTGFSGLKLTTRPTLTSLKIRDCMISSNDLLDIVSCLCVSTISDPSSTGEGRQVKFRSTLRELSIVEHYRLDGAAPFPSNAAPSSSNNPNGYLSAISASSDLFAAQHGAPRRHHASLLGGGGYNNPPTTFEALQNVLEMVGEDLEILEVELWGFPAGGSIGERVKGKNLNGPGASKTSRAKLPRSSIPSPWSAEPNVTHVATLLDDLVLLCPNLTRMSIGGDLCTDAILENLPPKLVELRIRNCLGVRGKGVQNWLEDLASGLDQSHSPPSLVPVPKTLVIESRFKDVWDHETTYEVQNLAWKLGVDWQMSKAEKFSVGFDRSTLY